MTPLLLSALSAAFGFAAGVLAEPIKVRVNQSFKDARIRSHINNEVLSVIVCELVEAANGRETEVLGAFSRFEVFDLYLELEKTLLIGAYGSSYRFSAIKFFYQQAKEIVELPLESSDRSEKAQWILEWVGRAAQDHKTFDRELSQDVRRLYKSKRFLKRCPSLKNLKPVKLHWE